MLTAGTAVRRVLAPGPQSADQIAALLHACDDLIQQHAPDWMGHCKALVEASSGSAYASITGAGEPISWRGVMPTSNQQPIVTLYCVAYGVSDKQMAEIIDQVISAHLPGATEITDAPQADQITLEVR